MGAVRGALREFLRGPVSWLLSAVSALMTLIAVVGKISGGGRFWMWLFFAALALVVLAFWRFYEIYKERSEREADAERSRGILQSVARSLMLGHRLVTVSPRSLYESDATYEEALERARDGARDWSRHTYRLLQDHVGWDQAALFESDYGLPERYDGPSSYLHTKEEIERYVARRCLRLEEIILELRRSG